MKWNYTGTSSLRDIKYISTTYHTDLLLSTILAKRGIIDADKVMYYLENDLTYLHSPFAFVEMEDFIERIQEAKDREETIAIHGDRDVDGITSTALLYNALKDYGIKVFYYVPLADEPYGLSKSGIDKDVENNVNLIITVDCGISSLEEVDYANSKNIDVIVIDHHLPGEVLPNTVATINPKVEDSGYPFGGLCACALVSKCIWALNYSTTPLYGQTLALIHLEDNGDYIMVEASLVRNSNTIYSFSEVFKPGMTNLEASKIYDICSQGYPLFCYEAEIQKKLMRKIFGKFTEINLSDLRPEIIKHFKQLENLSFTRIKTKSKSLKYYNNSSIKLLEFLFRAYVLKNYDELGSGYDNLLDLVAIATIADMMPLEDENRILVRRGLKVLEQSKRESLTELLLANKLIGKKIVTKDISWGLGPIINSSGRMGQANKAIELLTSTKTKEIQENTELLLSLNKQRKKLGEDIWPKIEKSARESYEDLDQKLTVVFNTSLARGITGIMAARLLNKFNCPSIVIAQVDDNTLIASGRSKEGFNIRDFFANFSDLLEDFGGHSCAGGFSMNKKNLPQLIEGINEYLEENDIIFGQDETLNVDAKIGHENMSTSLINIAEKFEPYGNGCDPINFLTEKMIIKDARELANSKDQSPSHLKLSLACNNVIWTALYWSGGPKLGRDFNIGDKVDVVYRLGRNYFRQQETIQLTVLDIKKSEEN